MIKLIIIFFMYTLSFSETIFNGKCVDDFYTLNNSTLKIFYSNVKTSTISESKAKIEELVSNIGYFKYNPDNNICELSLNNYYGMNEIQFNFLSALTGLLTAFLIVSIIQKKV